MKKEAIILPFKIILIVLAALIALVLLLSLVCFFLVFYSTKKSRIDKDEYPLPPGDEYIPYHPRIKEWLVAMRATECREVSVQSYDGLTLKGRYFEHHKGAPIEVLFHGYRGSSERDMAGGVARCFALGRNALIVDQRAAGKSEGSVITFGIKECRDVPVWVDFVVNNIDPDAKIIITGISMGASTVMMAASRPLHKNVVGVLADCGYTSAEAIIKKVLVDIKLPPKVVYPFVRLGAIIFGGFDPNSYSPIESMSKCTLPVIFYHGDEDGFVPCYMSEQNFAACASKQKKLVITPGAAHGLCYPRDEQGYLEALDAFFEPQLK